MDISPVLGPAAGAGITAILFLIRSWVESNKQDRKDAVTAETLKALAAELKFQIFEAANGKYVRTPLFIEEQKNVQEKLESLKSYVRDTLRRDIRHDVSNLLTGSQYLNDPSQHPK